MSGKSLRNGGKSAFMAAVSALWTALLLGGCGKNASSVAVIGGADGPTAIFIAGKSSESGRGLGWLLVGAVLVVLIGIVSWWRQKKK